MSQRLLIVLAVIPTLILCILVGVFAIAFLRGDIQISFSAATEAEVSETEPPTTEAPSTETTAPTLIPVREPASGYVFEDFDGLAESSCPLTVKASSSGCFYIVIDPVSMPFYGTSEFDRMTHDMTVEYCEVRIYLHSNSTVDILVPPGEYEIYYAIGDTWYGEDLLFGPDTQYYKCDGTFVFTEESDGYSGWTLTLETVYGGNLDTDVISEMEFPK
jgi:hypothetical protein